MQAADIFLDRRQRGGASDLVLGSKQMAQRLAHTLAEDFAEICERHAFGPPIEQLYPELLFDHLNGVANGGLSQV
jgi:hypothetical protein